MMFGGMGNMGNMAGMMKKVQKLQTEMKKMQEELKVKTVDVSTGGGAVKIVMNGDKQVVALTIDPAVVDPEDVEMLQDIISAAINEAIKKVDDMMASEMGKITGGLGLPPGMM
jgi:nucleoid-associated protein EbfC